MICQNPLCKTKEIASNSIWCSSFCRMQGTQGIKYNPEYPNNIERLLTDKEIQNKVKWEKEKNAEYQKRRKKGVSRCCDELIYLKTNPNEPRLKLMHCSGCGKPCLKKVK